MLLGQRDELDAWFKALARARAWKRRDGRENINPYRGLRSYRTEDADFFFGREEKTNELVTLAGDDCAHRRPTLVIGASGTGKSSLIAAGLVARLPAERTSGLVWTTPAEAPLPETGASRLVVVDQFEQSLTDAVAPDAREEYIRALYALAADGVMVVIALRADFFVRASRVSALDPLLSGAHLVLGEMTEPDLRQVIEKPAEKAGLEVRRELTEVLIRDLRHPFDSGALPLVSHTLAEIAKGAPDRVLSLERYQELGGVHGAVAQSAEDVFAGLTGEQRRIARRVFLDLAEEPGDAGPIRRVVPLDDLAAGADGAAVRDVLDLFVDARLLTVGESSVQVVHEILLTEWPELAGWLADDAEVRRLRGTVSAAATTWDRSGRDDGSLLRGALLDAALARFADPDGSRRLDQPVREFLRRSARRRDAETAARTRARRQRTLVIRGLIAVLAVVALIVVGMAGYTWQAHRSARESDAAAESRRLAAVAKRMLGSNIPVAGQLALTAHRISPTREAVEALVETTATPAVRRMSATAAAMAVSGDGRHVAEGGAHGTVRLWSASASSRPLTQVKATLTTGLKGPVSPVAENRDGTRAAAASGRTVVVWTLDGAGRRTAAPDVHDLAGAVSALAVAPDGGTVAAAVGDRVMVWTPRSTAPAPLSGPSTAVGTLAFSPDGRTLFAGGADPLIRRWDLADHARPTRLAPLSGAKSKIFSVAVSPDGRTLAAGLGAQHAVLLWDIGDPASTAPEGPPLTGPDSWVNTVAFSPDGGTLAAGSSDGLLWTYDVRGGHGGQGLQRYPHPHPVAQAAFRSATSMMSRSDDGSLLDWRPPGPLVTAPRDAVFAVSFDSTGTRMGVAPGVADGTATVWNTADPRVPVRLGPPILGRSGDAAFSGSGTLTPDGRTFAVGAVDGSVGLWDVTDPAHPSHLRTVRAAREQVEAITANAKGTLIAVACDDGTVRLVSTEVPSRARVVGTLRAGAGDDVYQASFSPDGTLLAAAGRDHHVYLWNVSDPAAPVPGPVLGGFGDAVFSTAFDRTGRLLATGSGDGTVRVWDVSDPARPDGGATLTGPAGYVYSLSFSRTTGTLAAASTDGAAWLWDVPDASSARPRATLTGPAKGLLAVVFRPDGRTLAAGSLDHTVRLWNTDTGEAAHLVCDAGGLPITPAEWEQYVGDRRYEPPCR